MIAPGSVAGMGAPGAVGLSGAPGMGAAPAGDLARPQVLKGGSSGLVSLSRGEMAAAGGAGNAGPVTIENNQQFSINVDSSSAGGLSPEEIAELIADKIAEMQQQAEAEGRAAYFDLN